MSGTRTGWVQVQLVGSTRTVRADSYGQAAGRIDCGPGQILYFEWVVPPKLGPKSAAYDDIWDP